MECSVGIRLIEGVSLKEQTSDVVAVEAPVDLYRQPMTLTGATASLRGALKRIQNESVPAPALMGQVMQTEGMIGLARLNQYIRKLDQFAFLSRQLLVDGVSWASIRPLSIYYRYEEGKLVKDQKYVLSRFVILRNDQQHLVVECPLGHAQIRCEAPETLLMLHALRQPCSLPDVGKAVAGATEECVNIFMTFLLSANALVSVADTTSPETTDPVLGPWEFHDLLFHTRSRLGRHDRPYGGTFPFKGTLAPLPIIKRPMSDRVVPLYRPDIELLKRTDTPFTEVLERRCSIREQGEPPITLQQLGEFLYRSARVKEIYEDAGVSFRPSAAGGALHELEIYVLPDRCEGLKQGLYHYNPQLHELHHLTDPNPYVNTLQKISAFTSKQDALPQVLFIIAARFQRLQHKYQSMTYALVLKNLGALYQTMYLVGSAMGLATSALGGGHSDIFAQAAGVNYLEEASVGEFILGTRKSASQTRRQTMP